MVNWSSPAEIANDTISFDMLIHCLLGLYIWEWVVSLDFDWQHITGKKKFRWPMTFYFLNRYCLMGALIGHTVALDITVQVNCRALYTFSQCLGNSAIGLASINLSLRTMVVWSRRWFIVAPLVIMILCHWLVLLRGAFLMGTWLPGKGCAIINEMDTTFGAATFIYSMVFDFVVLMLTAYKIYNPAVHRSKLIVLIFTDGLVYFAIAFLVNVIATVFILLHLNPVMTVIANIPAAIASTIVAGRVVRRLNNFTLIDTDLHPTTEDSTDFFRFGVFGYRAKSIHKPGDGVHIHVETSTSPNEGNIAEYDVTRNVTMGDKFDPEAQVIGQEFKRPPY